MKVKKAIKKLVALGTGAVMVGATILGATAADLGDYPSPFVKNGEFDGLIVVGQAAASMDVVGAIDIATSLQYAVKQTETINVQSSGTVSVSGDAFQIGSGGDMLEIDESIGTVTETLTENDLELLKGGVVTTSSGTSDYNQYLRLQQEGTNPVDFTGNVTYKKADNDEVGDYLFWNNGQWVFEYELQFEEGLKSANTSGTLSDLEDESLTMLGKTYSIVQATEADKLLTLTLLGGDVTDTLYEGETKTYTVNGEDFEVQALIISDTSTTVKFKVNGEVTKSLGDGETARLADGTEIGIRDILANEGTEEGGGDLVEFYLGANKVVLSDSDFTDTTYYTGAGLEVGEENVEDAKVMIAGTTSGSKYKINNIKVNLTADGKSGSDVYIPAGEGLRAHLDEPEGMISPDWDIKYEGLMDTGTSTIKLKSNGNDAYKLEFETQEGLSYSIPFVTNDGGTFKFGDDDQDLHFFERASGTEYIDRRDYFVVHSDAYSAANSTADSGYTRVLRFDSLDTSNDILTLSDLAAGQVEATYSGTSGTLNVGGTSYGFTVDEATTQIAVDLDNDGSMTAGEFVPIVTKGGAVITLNLNVTSLDTANNQAGNFHWMEVKTLAKRFDGAGSSESFFLKIDGPGDTTVDATIVADFRTGFTGLTTPMMNPDSKSNVLNMQTVEGQDLKRGMTKYGVLIEETSSTSSTDADEITIEYPLSQRGAMVYVTGGDVSTSKSSSSSGSIETVSLEKINVGAAKLDSEVSNVWGQNLILVGGPCANTAAATVMGVTAENCAEGFEEGKAMVKLYDKSGKVAMVVAGYSAMDTRRATRVVADYEKYASDMTGMEVEVAGTTLTDITVSQPE